MENKKEMTALDVSAATDTEQPISKCTDNSISEKAGKINDLETISMTELYDTVYPSKPPLIDGLLYTGTYLFVGAPKLGKSYLMAQLALSYQHRHTAMGLYRPKRNGAVSCS